MPVPDPLKPLGPRPTSDPEIPENIELGQE